MNPIPNAGGRRHLQHGIHSNCQTWGDPLLKKKKENIRIVFQNVNGFGYKKEDETKTKGLFDLMCRTDADVFTVAETNADWRKVPKRYTIWDQCKEWFENTPITASNNIHDRHKSQYQPGGTATITQGDLALQIMETGYDPLRLGRWSWILIRGKNNIKLRIVSVYRAKKPTEEGPRRAYAQQQQALLKLKIEQSPEEQFWTDLWDSITKWNDDGEQLILCGDWNQDVRQPAFLDQFSQHNLIPALMSKHDPTTAPETYNGGSDPIDEIFISSTLTVTGGGYLEHGSSQGDHRPLWIDLDKAAAIGTVFPDLPTHKARKLKCSDLRIVKKYLKHLDKYF